MHTLPAGREAGTEVSEARHVDGINPSQYYSWTRQLISGAAAIFGKRRGGKDEPVAVEPHEKEVTRGRDPTGGVE